MKLKMSDLNATSNVTLCDTGMYKVRTESGEVVILSYTLPRIHSLSVIVQAGGGGAHRHRGLGRANRSERLHEHRAHPPLGQRLQGRSGED